MSRLEDNLKLQLKALKIDGWCQEYKFHSDRRWRFDFAWPSQKIAVECDGAIWAGGRHLRPQGFINDCEKCNEAAILGWKVLRVTPEHIKNGKAINWINNLLFY